MFELPFNQFSLNHQSSFNTEKICDSTLLLISGITLNRKRQILTVNALETTFAPDTMWFYFCWFSIFIHELDVELQNSAAKLKFDIEFNNNDDTDKYY